MNTRQFKKIAVIIFIMIFTSYSCVYPLPEVDEVVSGAAEINISDPQTMNITATDNTIINYNSFNIGENERVFVTLPSSSSDILNRVVGGDASRLMGGLQCNGIFILVNPSGVYVGAAANIDVASLVLSTRDITNSDFLDGNYLFKKLSQEEVDMLLLNEGNIKIHDGGFGVLIAGAIENKGTIIAPAGKIALAAGDAVKLDICGNGLVAGCTR